MLRNPLIPAYIPDEWLNRVRVVIDDRGTHYLWIGWNNGEGHGKVRRPRFIIGTDSNGCLVKRRSVKAGFVYTHRDVYERVHGVKLGRFDIVDHLCERKACINVDHLEVVTSGVNTARGPGRYTQFKPAMRLGVHW